MAQAASQSRRRQSPAIDRSWNPGNAHRGLIALHKMPRRPLPFVPQRWNSDGPDAVGNWPGAVKKPRATLDRVLSKAGIASRTTTREWVQQGRVKVNGQVIRNPDHWVFSGKDVVHLDGLKIREEKK